MDLAMNEAEICDTVLYWDLKIMGGSCMFLISIIRDCNYWDHILTNLYIAIIFHHEIYDYYYISLETTAELLSING